MSAIFGIWNDAAQPVDAGDAERMRSRLSYRGPQGSGIWLHGPIALGHCLLPRTPESVFEQSPTLDSTRRFCITADARIDNRDDLIGALGLGAPEGRSYTDPQIILEAYKRWGRACPERLLGDFAFAIWDPVEEELFCARDHFGVKSLYYHAAQGRFAFSNGIEGLLNLTWVPKRLNELRLANHLTTYFGDKTSTFYADILRLPPAHWLVTNRSGLTVRSYWALNPDRETRFNSDADYVEAFTELFQSAVQVRLRSNGRAGAMLSGGLDSSSIAAVAGALQTKADRGPLPTFSATFDEIPRSNERQYIEAILERGEFEPYFLRADVMDPFLAPPIVASSQTEVHVAANMFLTWGLYGAAQKAGVGVILDGFDGDTTISHGVTYLSELAHENRWREVARLTPVVARTYELSQRKLLWAYAWHEGISRIIPSRGQTLGRRMMGFAQRLLPRAARSGACDCILNPDFVRKVGLREYRQSLSSTWGHSPSTEKQAHYETLRWGVMPATLEMLETAAAPFGIDVRFPFWDRRLVDFCLGLPPQCKIRQEGTRWILRKAMEGRLPAKVQWRPDKSNIGHAFKHCMLNHGRSRLEAGLQSAKTNLRPYLCANHLERSTRSLRRLPGDREALYLWQVANLALWIKQTGIRA